MNKPMTLLLIEDEETERQRFKEAAMSRPDITIAGMTSSSFEGVDLVINRLPEAVILDLELHRGEGSGLIFLSSIRDADIPFKPLIVVTTNTSSPVVYAHLHDSGADLIFYKKQTDYSPEMVFNSVLSLRKSLHIGNTAQVPKEIATTESPEAFKNRVSDIINSELDLIGIGNHLKGRKYLFDAIFLLIHAKSTDDFSGAFNQVANKYKRAYSSISRAMQTSINNAWRISSIDDLQSLYTARINYETGVPTPTEFVYYYANKIKKRL